MDQSVEETFLAGIKSLREREQFRLQLSQRIASLNQGIEIETDEALAAFFDEIDAEVDVCSQSL